MNRVDLWPGEATLLAQLNGSALPSNPIRVRGAFISSVLTGNTPAKIGVGGFQLISATVVGDVLLAHANIKWRTIFIRCAFEGAFIIQGASLAELDCNECLFAGPIHGQGVHSSRQLAFRNGSLTLESLDLRGAKVDGPIDLSNLRAHRDVFLDNANSAMSVLLHRSSAKSVSMQALQSGGSIDLRHTTISNLNADDARATSSLILDNATIENARFMQLSVGTSAYAHETTFGSTAYFNNCSIGGDFHFRHCTASGAPASLVFAGSRIGAFLLVEHCNFTHGTIDLLGAEVGQAIQFTDCNISSRADPPAVRLWQSLVGGNLVFDRCTIRGEIQTRNATIRGSLGIHRTQITATCRGSPPIDASNTSFLGSISIGPSVSCQGTIDLHGSTVGGSISLLEVSSWPSPGSPALNWQGMRIEKGAAVTDSLIAGTILLSNLHAGHNIEVSSTLIYSTGIAVAAHGASIGGSLLLRCGIHAIGTVLVRNTSAREIDLHDGTFSGDGARSIAIHNCAVAQDALFDGSTYYDTVCLTETSVGGTLRFLQSTVRCLPHRIAVDISNTHARRAEFVQTEIRGALSAKGLHANEEVVFQDFSVRNWGQPGIDLQAASVDGALVMRNTRALAGVSLLLARTDILADSSDSWLGQGWTLDGFEYKRIAAGSPTSAEERLDWLALQSDMLLPQPAKWLGKTLDAQGLADEGNRILIDRERRLTSEYKGVRKCVHTAHGLLLGYGYQKHRLLAWLAGWLTASTAVFFLLLKFRLIVPAEGSVRTNTILDSAALAVGLFFPGSDLVGADQWNPVSSVAEGCILLHQVVGLLVTYVGLATVVGFAAPRLLNQRE